ncbi:MAG TPA: NAD(P)-dependent oxidoreductase, partial [Pyrinomonadaceae bacterium]|nr:NAD(P)-dependent oxidoreductase [Pyrinomonadaceae bacterium]
AEQGARLLAEIAPTHLLHLAWYTEPGKYWTATENLAWVRASLELLAAFVRAGGRRVVLAGTCAEYDWTGNGLCDEAQTPLRPATLYGTCKDALRQMLEAYARQTDLSAAWGRIFFLYGPHEYPQRLVAAVVRGLLRRERVPCSQGTQLRDFLYVQDVAEAFVALLESDVQGAVNIASGQGVMLREMVDKIAAELAGRDLVEFGALPNAAGEPARLVAAVKRLREEVGWQPRFTLDEGLARTIAWWRAHV